MLRGRLPRARERLAVDTENLCGAGVSWLMARHAVPPGMDGEYQALRACAYLTLWHGRRVNAALRAVPTDETPDAA